MNIRSKEDLQLYINNGNKVKYIFFWGHQKSKKGITKSCFSQWYDVSFEEEGIKYISAEHYMMAEKGRLFGDEEMVEKIIASTNPREAKKSGREIRNFDEALWLNHRWDIVVRANLLKFGQSEELKEFLINTNERILVEASPVDKIWGVGLAADDETIENPKKWKGLNLLGFALMEVREKLRENL